MTAQYQVGPDTVVHFSYRLFDEEGELVEQNDPAAPLSFLFGYAQLHPAVERLIEGAVPGDTKRGSLPREAFGARSADAIIEVARDELPSGAQVGDEFDADHESQGAVSLVVLELTEEIAVLDANHPLAGQVAEIEVRVEAVRPADSREIALAEADLEAGNRDHQGLLPSARLLQRTATGSSLKPLHEDPKLPSGKPQ